MTLNYILDASITDVEVDGHVDYIGPYKVVNKYDNDELLSEEQLND